jgi:peptidoglycan/LPS O-acetylase OafA/YrhL
MTTRIDRDCEQPTEQFAGVSIGTPGQDAGRSGRPDMPTANSRNLDFLRSAAVLLVVCFHLAKFFNWQFSKLQVTDFGLLGVMLFFVHTTLVLMFSLERQRAKSNAPLFLPFMVRRCFRIYPLAVLAVTFVYLFRIPSDLQFGRFDLLHQTAGNLAANLLLIQNVTRQKANPGPLWSLPLELQMYLVLPALFLLASRVKSPWATIAFWWSTVGLWFSVGLFTGLLPLSEGGIRSPVEALLKFTRFAPCFLPGIVAYKLWGRPRLLPGFLWPVFLFLCCAMYVLFSGSQPIETGWFICFAIGLGVCLFRELRISPITRVAQIVARYSYGIYVLHYFAIWLGFSAGKHLDIRLQFTIFLTTLISVSVILYHGVEAPMIGLGVKVSGKFKSPLFPPWKTLFTVFGLRNRSLKLFENMNQKRVP